MSRLAEPSCKFNCFSASQAALVLLSYSGVSQAGRTGAEMFSKGLHHSLLCCTSTVLGCAGRNKPAQLHQHCQLHPECSPLQHSTAEVVSTAQGSQETCCAFGLKAFSFLSLGSGRTSFAANMFLLVNTEIFLCVGGWAP